MFNAKFGTSVDLRLVKLREEFGELMEASEKDIYQSKENLDDFIDELADVNAVVFHIAEILGLTQDELLSMAADKVIGREKDPNYKRKHPHVEHNSMNTLKFYYAVNKNGQGRIFKDKPRRDTILEMWVGQYDGSVTMVVANMESLGFVLPKIKWSDEPVELTLLLAYET